MSRYRHNAIICTGECHEISIDHKKAMELFEGKVTNIVEAVTNSYSSFMIVPDGSKEGYDTSDEWDNKREEYINYLESYNLEKLKDCDGINYNKYDSLSSYINYVEIEYGGFDSTVEILKSNN